MHMADALVSPAIGGTMWVISAGLVGYSSRQAKKQLDDRTAPLMGVMGAFVFAIQMINFAIPGTGSSGHLGGGLLLAILLGPWAGFLTISSILTIQSLFFADGGILALGCNIFNIGIIPCLVAYPLIYRPVANANPTRKRIFIGSILAAVTGLQLGALGVVLQTTLSGITELPMLTFALFMQPIHLGIGLVEGLATASIILFLFAARPDLLHCSTSKQPVTRSSITPVLKTFALAALLAGGIFSLFASASPDGLEWSIFQTSGKEHIAGSQNVLHDTTAKIQKHSAVLPDYGFAKTKSDTVAFSGPVNDRIGTTVSGLVGTILFLLFAGIVSLLLRIRSERA